jgi:hypothetical protein
MKEPPTPNYRNHVFELQTSIPNLYLMSMNSNFQSNERENLARGLVQKSRNFGYCTEENFDNSKPVVLPNGDTYLCCRDYHLKDFVGNLLCESYLDICQKIVNGKGRFSTCDFCKANQPFHTHFVEKTSVLVKKLFLHWC